jgi:hypothetical protein
VTDFMPNGANSVACTVGSCDRMVKARGYCATHYARLRRTGSADKVRKAGCPQKPFNIHVGQMLSEWSPRTQSRYIYAVRILNAFGADSVTALVECTRAGGSINVSQLVRLADSTVMKWLREHESGECR